MSGQAIIFPVYKVSVVAGGKNYEALCGDYRVAVVLG